MEQRRQAGGEDDPAQLPPRLAGSNEVRLWLSVVAYNLGNLWRHLVLPKRIGQWSLTSLQQRLVKTGARLIKHARYYWLLLAESIAAATRDGCLEAWCGGSPRCPCRPDRARRRASEQVEGTRDAEREV